MCKDRNWDAKKVTTSTPGHITQFIIHKCGDKVKAVKGKSMQPLFRLLPFGIVQYVPMRASASGESTPKPGILRAISGTHPTSTLSHPPILRHNPKIAIARHYLKIAILCHCPKIHPHPSRKRYPTSLERRARYRCWTDDRIRLMERTVTLCDTWHCVGQSRECTALAGCTPIAIEATEVYQCGFVQGNFPRSGACREPVGCRSLRGLVSSRAALLFSGGMIANLQ
ncbi:hypothetical protein B0H10DRAFT_539137 [Mycena sp. CBHHK59/15]|nr:hypothetical protein B0H10DRAFT_539137 [Mycena sp. CBHHK59/15]